MSPQEVSCSIVLAALSPVPFVFWLTRGGTDLDVLEMQGDTGLSSVVLDIKHAGLGVEEADDGASVGGGEDSNSRDDFALAAKHPGLPVGE